MKTYSYKTVSGLFRSAKNNQITIESLLNGQMYINRGYNRISLSEEALKQIAELVGNYLYDTKSRANEVKEGIIERKGDNSFLQCFYLCKGKKGFYVSNSLSGEAFAYCRRKFRQSI